MKTISLRIPDSLSRSLRSAAKRRRVTASELIRQTLEQNITDTKARPSCLDLTADLLGRSPGATDLSANPRHLEDFGK